MTFARARTDSVGVTATVSCRMLTASNQSDADVLVSVIFKRHALEFAMSAALSIHITLNIVSPKDLMIVVRPVETVKAVPLCSESSHACLTARMLATPCMVVKMALGLSKMDSVCPTQTQTVSTDQNALKEPVHAPIKMANAFFCRTAIVRIDS